MRVFNKIYLLAGSFAALVLAILAIWFLAASLSEQPGEEPAVPTTSESENGPLFTLEVNGLEPLTSGNVYELWVLRGGQTDSPATNLGRFNVWPGGQGHAGEFVETMPELDSGDIVLITVENSDGEADRPSSTVVLRGEVGSDAGDKINLAFPFDFSRSSGNNYILGTPTNDPIGLESAGVWFVRPGGREASLNLPDSEEGWRYEGWVFHGGRYLSAGRFAGVRSGDDFNGYSSVKSAPDFPGEDFLENLPEAIEPPVNLSDGASRVIVSLEAEIRLLAPEERDQLSPSPYVVLLEADIPTGAVAHTLYPLQLKNGSFPTGSFQLIPAAQ